MIKQILVILFFLSLSNLFSDDKSDADNHSNQMNPNNDAYWESRGYDERPEDWEDGGNERDYSNSDMDNHSNQMNPNNDAYWQSRGYDERPDNWGDGKNERGYKKSDWDNHSNQMNPNNEAYWESRGYNKNNYSDNNYESKVIVLYNRIKSFFTNNKSSKPNYCRTYNLFNNASKESSGKLNSNYFADMEAMYAKKCDEQKRRAIMYKQNHPIEYALKVFWKKYSTLIYWCGGIYFFFYFVGKIFSK